MNVRRFLPIVALVVLASAVPAFAQAKIAIANPVAIFDQMDERKVAEDSIKATAQGLQQRLDDQRKALELQQKNINFNLKAGTTAYQEAMSKLMQDAIQLEASAKYQQIQLTQKQAELVLGLFNKIQDAIKAEAAGKFDLVITDQRPELPTADQLTGVDIKQLQARILGRTVLYVNETAAIDLTKAVRDRLNLEYKNKPTTNP